MGAILEQIYALKNANFYIKWESHPYEDVANRVIFVKDKQVVFHEDVFPSIEAPHHNELIFMLPDTVFYAEFTKQTAQFLIVQEYIKDRKIFEAIPIY
jgi:hypothetical protein